MSSKQDILASFAEVQLSCLNAKDAPPIDDPATIAVEILEYLRSVPGILTTAIGVILDHIDATAKNVAGDHFAALSLAQRETVLDTLWRDMLWHDLVSLVARLSWLVIYSRDPARSAIGFSLPPTLPPPVHIPAPPDAPLNVVYDVCVIGSGAGGAVTAALLAEQQKHVLLIEEGPWISPRDFHVRDDQGLAQLYRNSGLQPAWPDAHHLIIKHGIGFMTVLQGRVIGGGPTVNNAIHLPIQKSRWEEWQSEYDFPVDWKDLDGALATVAADLGVSTSEMRTAMGERSKALEVGATALHLPLGDLPVAIRSCVGCGGCNVGCRFGLKTGGLHGPRLVGAPRSYLERALAAGAEVRSSLRATRLLAPAFTRRVTELVCQDLKDANREVTVKAGAFVIAAGPIASSKLLRKSGFQLLSPIGAGIAANVNTPVFALLDHDISPGPLNPGLQMCVFVDQGGRLLETWFHYPGSLAAALPGWLHDHAAIMRNYPRLAACGVVVPTGNRGMIGLTGDLVLSLSTAELAQMTEGVLSIADAFFAAGAKAVFPATAQPCTIRADHQDEDKAAFRALVQGPADLTLSTPHPQGGNAIGRKATASVVRPDFRLFDFDNVYVADASLFPAGCYRNPQMTTMALAHLAARNI